MMNAITITRSQLRAAVLSAITQARPVLDADAIARLHDVADTAIVLDSNYEDEGHGGCVATQAALATGPQRSVFAFAFDDAMSHMDKLAFEDEFYRVIG